MAITTAICSSFRRELLKAEHDFTPSTGHDMKLALFLNAATLGASTTAYSTSSEASGTGYTAGGKLLTLADPALDGVVAVVDFDDLVWSNATITARGALIYNADNSNKAVSVHSFGSDKVSTGGDFIVTVPAPAAATAIIRI